MRSKNRLSWRLLPSYVGMTALTMAVVGWYSIVVLSELADSEAVAGLTFQARLVGNMVGNRFLLERSEEVADTLREFSETGPFRITVLLASGRILAESRQDISRSGDQLSRPEVEEAIAGRVGLARRYSFGADREVLYVAVPIESDGKVRGIVRISQPRAFFSTQLRIIGPSLLIPGIILVCLSIILGLFIARSINRPIAILASGAARIDAGDLHHRQSVTAWTELDELADAINIMADRLQDRIVNVVHQRNELEAVLAGMVEAVIVVDNDERIVKLNKAAERLFRIDEQKNKGRAVQEVIRNTELHDFVFSVLAGHRPTEADITIIGDPETFLQAHGAGLQDEKGRNVGAVVVLNDVTRLKTLESIRRDFVANVSHELKTPVTSIKGFLETLREGAMYDPANAQRFLDIVIAQTDRLVMIIEDLLTLSRIERDSEKGDITLREASVKEVLETVVKACQSKAGEKNITLNCDIEDELVARINPTLLEQAIINLIDNALKYSDPGKSIRVVAAKRSQEIVIKVIDQGCGIPKDHLNRIFERFYRVDKARSRKVGGTGLGLSIVKHIAHAHAGHVSVESSPGRGSTFSVHIPLRTAN